MDDNVVPVSTPWDKVVHAALASGGKGIPCPRCQAPSATVAWCMAELNSRQAKLVLHCASCGASDSTVIALPPGVPAFFPPEQLASFIKSMEEQIKPLAERIRQQAQSMPAATFVTDPLWAEAKWSATTYQWHPKSEAPPILGLIFDNAEAGKELFRRYAKAINHTDRFEELRVALIEGSRPGEPYGYSVHLSPDPESLAAHATMEGVVLEKHLIHFLGQWTRAYPISGAKPLLPKFKMEFARHREYLLAPVLRKSDGQLWTEPSLGIIKNTILLRQLSEITPEDPDAGALILPDLIKP